MNFEIKNVSLTIEGKRIVRNVSISVRPGEVVGLMGPNGAGKTSTFNLAVGNLKPDKGDIFMNRKLITNLPLPSRSRLGLGYLTQEASIFRDLTVKENIDLALQNSFFSSAVIRNKGEKIITPHPRMHERNFTLIPLYEIKKNWIHPKNKQKIDILIKKLNPKSISDIKIYQSNGIIKYA